MKTILRAGLSAALLAALAALVACGPSPQLARDTEAGILAEEERDLTRRLAIWQSELRALRTPAPGPPTPKDPTSVLDDRAEVIIALEIAIAQHRARLRQCRQRRADQAIAPVRK